MDASYLEHCKNVLKQNGYVVLRQERRVIITANYIVPPQEMEYSRLNSERYADIAQAANHRRLIHEAETHGLILHERQDINDPVTGREIVFKYAMGLIKPK